MSKQIITWNNIPITYNGIPLMYNVPPHQDLKYVDIWLYKNGASTDNVFLEIRSGSYTGTVLGTSDSLNGATLTTTATQTRFTFSTPIILNSGTQYYLRANRDGVVSTINYYVLSVNNTNPYSSGVMGYAGGQQVTMDIPLILSNPDNTTILDIPDIGGAGTVFGYNTAAALYIWQSFIL